MNKKIIFTFTGTLFLMQSALCIEKLASMNPTEEGDKKIDAMVHDQSSSDKGSYQRDGRRGRDRHNRDIQNLQSQINDLKTIVNVLQQRVKWATGNVDSLRRDVINLNEKFRTLQYK